MDETKVQIGEEVLLDIGIHSEWYISSLGYDGESVDVKLCRKVNQNKGWWLANTPQTHKVDLGSGFSITANTVDTTQAKSYYTDTIHFGKAEGKSITINTADTPQTERSVCDTCYVYNSGIPCGVEPSVCKREVKDKPQTEREGE